MNYCYDATFSNNILLLGQTGCGKTSFEQNLGKNKIFGEGLLRVDWVSKIDLTKEREDKFDNVLTIQLLSFTIQITLMT